MIMKKISCSIKGEQLSCKLKENHVVIILTKESLYLWSLNSLH